MGIEPTSSAWKAEVLPLNYTRLVLRSAFPITRFIQRAKNSDSLFSNRLNFSNLKCAPSPKRNRCVRDSNSEASQIASRGVSSSVNFQQTSPATPSAILAATFHRQYSVLVEGVGFEPT